MYPAQRKECPVFFRNKEVLMAPSVWQNAGVRMTRLFQYPGDIVVMMPMGIRGGINLGFNINEAINIATPE